MVSEKSYLLRIPTNVLIRQTNSQSIVNVTAKEFMFGYESTLTTLGNQFLPDWIYFDKVGLIDRVSISFKYTVFSIFNATVRLKKLRSFLRQTFAFFSHFHCTLSIMISKISSLNIFKKTGLININSYLKKIQRCFYPQ